MAASHCQSLSAPSFEPRFGYDFSQVRIHTDARAAESARAVNARAYTVGREVVFGAGQYSPGTAAGQRLLAHELTHIVQQRASAPSVQLKPLAEEEKLEDLKSSKFAGNPRLEEAFDNNPPLGIGESGEAVRLVQEGLVADGFMMPRSTKPTGEMDGSFGIETFTVVKEFQTKNGLDADGIVGRQTMGKLDDLAQVSPPVSPGTVPPGPLPPCPQGTQPTISSFQKVSFLPPAAILPLPGITCQQRGVPPTRLPADFARVRNVRVVPSKSAKVLRQAASKGKTSVVLDKPMTAMGTAAVVGGPQSQNFTFGFIQLCRPFDVVRAIYHSGITNDEVDFNATMNSRQGQPSIDSLGQPGNWFMNKVADPKAPGGEKMEEAKASPNPTPAGRTSPPVSIVFQDPPGVPFDVERQRVRFVNGKREDVFYELVGVAVEFFFFTAFAVELPSGKLEPLQTFYWDMKYCEEIQPGTLTKDHLGGGVNVSPVRDCLSGSCDLGEPKFRELAVDKTEKRPPCLTLAQSAFASTKDSSLGKFDISCK